MSDIDDTIESLDNWQVGRLVEISFAGLDHRMSVPKDLEGLKGVLVNHQGGSYWQVWLPDKNCTLRISSVYLNLLAFDPQAVVKWRMKNRANGRTKKAAERNH